MASSGSESRNGILPLGIRALGRQNRTSARWAPAGVDLKACQPKSYSWRRPDYSAQSLAALLLIPVSSKVLFLQRHSRIRLMRLLGLFGSSWALGVLLYWVVGSIIDGRPMGSGDFSAAALYSGVMFVVTAPVLYLPAMWLARRVAAIRSAVLVMTGVTLIHSVVATALVIAAFGGFRPASLLTAEAFLFYVIFGTAGALLGAGYLLWFRPRVT